MVFRVGGLVLSLLMAAAPAFAQNDKPKEAPKAEAAPADAAKAEAAPEKPAGPEGADTSKMDEKQKTSYCVGLSFGSAIADGASLLDMDSLMAGMKDAIAKANIKMTDEEMQTLLQNLQKKMMEQRYGATKKAGEDFLAENAKKEGVKTLPSGLQYKVITEGTGRTPKETDTVETNYKGTFTDGKEFDSSYKRNKPAQFPVTRVIPGWTEALLLMKEGAKWELYVPYKLAYGEEGRPPQIPPFSVLVFEIELLKIVDAAAGSQSVTIKPQTQAAPKPAAPK